MEKPDVQKVVSGLKACGTGTWDECEKCPYNGLDTEIDKCWEQLCLDAARLLEGGAG